MGLPSFIRRLGYIKSIDKAMGAFDPNAKPQVLKEEAPSPAKGKGGKGKGGKK